MESKTTVFRGRPGTKRGKKLYPRIGRHKAVYAEEKVEDMMSHMKRLLDENPHGICEAYIVSQETALNTLKDQNQELLEALKEVLELAGQPHACCAERMDDDDPCEAEGYGDGNREEHKVLEKAVQLIDKVEGGA
jgi:hypothetical protein